MEVICFLIDLFTTDLSILASPFHPNIFASCSADGTVKIWHERVSFVSLIESLTELVIDVVVENV